jgi:hypothetical protein
MRRLQTQCDTCGEVSLRANDFIVSTTADFDQVNCWFRCPGCGADVEQHCDAETSRLLMMSGAHTRIARAPRGNPMGQAELDELRAALERPDFIDLIRKGGPGS